MSDSCAVVLRQIWRLSMADKHVVLSWLIRLPWIVGTHVTLQHPTWLISIEGKHAAPLRRTWPSVMVDTHGLLLRRCGAAVDLDMCASALRLFEPFVVQGMYVWNHCRCERIWMTDMNGSFLCHF